MVESKPPNFSPEWVDDTKVPDNEHNNPQVVKSNKWKKKHNSNKTSPGSTPSGMNKFKVRTKDLEGYIFDLGSKKSDMYENTYKDICRYVDHIFGRYFQTLISDMRLMVF